MVKKLELEAEHNKLVIRIVNRLNWCRLYLIDDKKYFLGAVNYENIRDNLISYLRKEDMYKKDIYDYKGYHLVCIALLSERHYALYGTVPKDNTMVIICEDAQEKIGHLLPEIKLSENRIKEWINRLENFITKH